MAQQVALKAVTGRELGTSSSRRLRRTGQIPGVDYPHHACDDSQPAGQKQRLATIAAAARQYVREGQ